MLKQTKKKMALLNKLLQFDICYMNTQNNITYNLTAMDPPAIIKSDFNKVLSNASSAARVKPYMLMDYESSLGFRFMICPIHGTDEKYGGCVIMGPILLDTTDFNASAHTIQEDFDLLKAYSTHLEVVSEDTYHMVRVLFYNTIINDFVDPKYRSETLSEYIAVDTVSNKDAYYDYNNFTKFLKQNHANFQLTMSYITSGNIEKLKEQNKAIKSNETFLFTKRSPLTKQRNLKDLQITMNSLALRAAIKGSLPVILGYHLSNSFVVRIELANSISQLHKLSAEIPETYCQFVREYANAQHSRITKLAIDYILINLSSRFTVKEMAEALYTNPSYLSRKFKMDTGYSVSEYIRREKLKQAKLLIRESQYTLTEIAELSGFSSYTNFSKVFKKEMKMTPKEYKTKMLAKDGIAYTK